MLVCSASGRYQLTLYPSLAEPCDSIVFAPKGCSGCSDYSCSKRLQLTPDDVPGRSVSFPVSSADTTGALICSTAQLSVTSGINGSDAVFDWAPLNKAGVNFVFAAAHSSDRATCGHFSLVSRDCLSAILGSSAALLFQDETQVTVTGIPVLHMMQNQFEQPDPCCVLARS